MANQSSSANTARIAKNTVMLYIRMIFTMLIALYTSRVILQTLGVDDYGIYNVVGGFVSMFLILSGALSNSISRFITYELGKGNESRLRDIFSTGINIQVIMSILVIVIGELVGVWFLNSKMNIPPDRLIAANWVLQFSILSFCLNLISVPYNAEVIAHERMSVFAVISILESLLKLGIVFLLLVSPYDRLISYSFLLLLVNLLIRFIYGIYCSKHFSECKYKKVEDKAIIKEMTSFAGWNFFGNVTYMLNTQGVNMLMNVFFGVAVNAARGVAGQVDTAIRQFVNSFTTAVNPQITKSYASGDIEYMHSLICRSSKFSLYLVLYFAVPIILEAEIILKLWLDVVPDYSATFVRLIILNTIADSVLGNSLVTAVNATGKIKRYQIVMTIVSSFVFPLTWIAFKFGMGPEIAYIVYFVVFVILIFLRLYLIKDLINMPPSLYVKRVLLPGIPIALLCFAIPGIIHYLMGTGILRLLTVGLVSVVMTTALVYMLGLSTGERQFLTAKATTMVKRIIIKNKK